MSYVTIDFEASCLPRHGRSFPIEVGICGPEGTRSWLIKPHSLWCDWAWTDEAARLHGIGRNDLERDGLAPHVVMAQLTAAIAGRQVIADSSLDADWWRMLATATEVPASCPVGHVSSFLDQLGVTSAQIEAGVRLVDKICAGRHRAGQDARWLWLLLSHLEELVAAPSVLRKAA